jgi:hypothetical protein
MRGKHSGRKLSGHIAGMFFSRARMILRVTVEALEAGQLDNNPGLANGKT